MYLCLICAKSILFNEVEAVLNRNYGTKTQEVDLDNQGFSRGPLILDIYASTLA